VEGHPGGKSGKSFCLVGLKEACCDNGCRPLRRRGTQYAAAVMMTTTNGAYRISAFAGMTAGQ